MKIFIGSSEKKKPKAKKIAMELRRYGFDVYEWWSKQVFKAGDITITRLIEMSDICDGAVFVFGADDLTIAEVKDASGTRIIKIPSPRDNVILEYGIFSSKLGIARTLFVTDQDVKVPTDLLGVTYGRRRGYAKWVAERFREVLRTFRASPAPSKITVHISKTVTQALLSGSARDWSSRALYLGSRGALAWRRVEEDPKYTGRSDFTAVEQSIKTLAENNIRGYDTIISLGPGMGVLDKKVVPYLRGRQIVRYIPVDINHYLAVQAAEALDRTYPDVRVPFCVVGDFEDGMSDIAETIHFHSAPGRLFLMLGGTFGNLERSENSFLNGLADCLGPDDVALLDVFTAVSGYERANDPLLPLSKQPKSVQHFLASAIERRKGIPVADVLTDIDSQIQIVDSESSIPRTEAFKFQASTGEEIIHVRRYYYNEFGKHLDNMGFKVIASHAVNDPERKVGRAIFFLQRK